MTTILKWTQDQFADKLLEDDREPFLTFQNPLDNHGPRTFVLLAPSGQFWRQTILLTLVFQAITVLFSIVVYFVIVKPKQRHKQQHGTSTSSTTIITTSTRSTTSFIIGYGILIPFGFYVSYWLLDVLDLRNKDVKICTTMLSTVLVFRTIHVMHDTIPSSAATSSLSNLILYYNSMVYYKWNDKTNQVEKSTAKDTIKLLLKCIVKFHFNSLNSTILCYFNNKVIASSPVPIDSFNLSWDLLHPAHLVNCYFLAFAYLVVADFGLSAAALGENLKGFATLPSFSNPLLTSTSPSDFWGRKWNLTLHRTLKAGVYEPLRSNNVPTDIALCATFAVSGLLHDFFSSLVFYRNENRFESDSKNNQHFIHSKMLAFFLYNFLLIMIERHFVDKYCPEKIKKIWNQQIPLPLRSTIIVCLSLPVSHWFTSQWALGGLFSDRSLGYWKIIPQNKANF